MEMTCNGSNGCGCPSFDLFEYCGKLEQGVLKMRWLLNSGQGDLAAQLLETVAAEAEVRNISGQMADRKLDHDADTAAAQEVRRAGRLNQGARCEILRSHLTVVSGTPFDVRVTSSVEGRFRLGDSRKLELRCV